MKKLLVIAIAAFAFTACNNSAKEGDAKGTDSASAQTPTEQPAATPEQPAATPEQPAANPAPAEGSAAPAAPAEAEKPAASH